MRQTWHDLTFLHWRYPPDAVRPLLPPHLELELYDGAAWIGLVPFAIESAGWLPSFLETNVRTYVRDRAGNRGVWFFSLDAASLAAVLGARVAYALPYFWARMNLERQGDEVRYQSRRIAGTRAGCNLEIEIGEPIAVPTELDTFLTARYRLYTRRLGRLWQAEIQHAPWPLQKAIPVRVDQTLLESASLPAPTGKPLAHFSARIEVNIGGPKPSWNRTYCFGRTTRP